MASQPNAGLDSLMNALPTKLKIDSVEEALFELRFDTQQLGELFIGRLAGQFGSATRLPTADVPLPVRNANPALAYQPTLQVQSATGRVAKIGDRVFSWHALAPYPGWTTFRAEISHVFSLLREAIPDAKPKRLGLRYVNVFDGRKHKVGSVSDLNLSIEIGDRLLNAPLNLNYLKKKESQDLVVRIATPEFVTAPAGKAFGVLLDLDVYQESEKLPALEEIPNWIEKAHLILKEEYFSLLRPETVEELTEA